MPRRLVQTFLEAALNDAKTFKPGDRYRPAKLTREEGEAIDIIDGADYAKVKLRKGKAIQAQRVILATGNLQQREIPCVTEGDLRDKFFRKHFIRNQWLGDEQKKMHEIHADAPVLVIGTALSAYDAARTLLRQGHTGKIVLMSRHGLEHFEYPENHEWPDIELPPPRFLKHVLNRNWNKAKEEAVKEFRDLTGLLVNMDEGTITSDSKWPREFNFQQELLPEQVLKQWEKAVPGISNSLGAARVGEFLKNYSALVSVLRVGAGHSICEEIKAAKARGQIEVVAADIHGVNPMPEENTLRVRYTRRDEKEPRYENFHTVISSLGPDNDYTHIHDRLWCNILRRGYTTAHPVGIGVKTLASDREYGNLLYANRIFAAGVSTAGDNVVNKGLMGPPAFSVPGMRDAIAKTADVIVDGLRSENGSIPRFSM
jgi:uncharacterized NAD(P)/FAD-binding protein YdhS